MATAQSPAVKRLLEDLEQLKENPVLGVNAEPYGDDMMVWYGLVLGIEGTPYVGIPIRFRLVFSSNYPEKAPNVYFQTYVPYDDGEGSLRDKLGRFIVRIDLFENFVNIHKEWTDEPDGWKPSYTVRTILLSMQGFMMSNLLSTREFDIQGMRQEALKFRCPITGHVGDDRTKWFPQVITDQSVIDAIVKASDRSIFDPLRDFYICHVTKTSVKNGALIGYKIIVENTETETLISSSCEYLSYEAFQYETRDRWPIQPSEFWIPILIHSNKWADISPYFCVEVDRITRKFPRFGISLLRAPVCAQVFKVCSSIMNSLVVEIMKNERNTAANDKFINGYLSFYRLLVEYSKEDKSIVEMADWELGNFIASPQNRSKTNVPNLGEFLIYLIISSKYSWADLSKPFIAECDARNVFSYAVGNSSNPPTCPALIAESVVGGRSKKVFELTKVSRNLVLFQARFCKVAKQLSPKILDDNMGLAPDDLRMELKDLYNRISAVQDWNDYFEWLDMKPMSEKSRDMELVNALKLSRQQGYHRRPVTERPSYFSNFSYYY